MSLTHRLSDARLVNAASVIRWSTPYASGFIVN